MTKRMRIPPAATRVEGLVYAVNSVEDGLDAKRIQREAEKLELRVVEPTRTADVDGIFCELADWRESSDDYANVVGSLIVRFRKHGGHEAWGFIALP